VAYGKFFFIYYKINAILQDWFNDMIHAIYLKHFNGFMEKTKRRDTSIHNINF